MTLRKSRNTLGFPLIASVFEKS